MLLSDVVSALFLVDDQAVDFSGFVFERGRFYHLSLADTSVTNIQLVDCSFDSLDIADGDTKGISVSNSVVLRLAGIAKLEHAPPWFMSCLVDTLQKTSTLSAIREVGLGVSHTFLLSSLRKLFLQPGGGRKEASMYKGYGDAGTKRVCEKVIALLVREGFCGKFKGESLSLIHI